MNQEILNIKLNYKDVMFLLGVSEDDSKRMLRSLLTEEERKDLISNKIFEDEI